MNTLKKFSPRTVPGYVNVLGTATNTATVSLWSNESTALYTSATRKGDYFRGEIPVTKGVRVEVARLVSFASARWTLAGWSQRDQHHPRMVARLALRAVVPRRAPRNEPGEATPSKGSRIRPLKPVGARPTAPQTPSQQDGEADGTRPRPNT